MKAATSDRRWSIPSYGYDRGPYVGGPGHARGVQHHPIALQAARCSRNPRHGSPSRSLACDRHRSLIFFNRLDASLGLQTVMSIQIIATIPLVAVIVSSRLMRFERVQEESAIDLGASQLQVLRYVLLPRIAPALAASAILSFTWSFNNFTITYFVGGFQLLFPVWVFSTLKRAQNLPIVNAISTFVSVVQVLLIYAAWRLVKLRSASDRDAAESLVGGLRR